MSAVSYARVWNRDDDGDSFVHLVSDGNDYTVCGHDIAGDELVHLKPPVELSGFHKVTCPQCVATIATVKAHLDRAKK